NQGESLSVVARHEPVRGLRDDRNAVLEAGILPGVGFEIGGQRAQLFGDDVTDEILSSLTVKRRIRSGKTGPALERRIEGLRREGFLRGWEGFRREGLQAQQKRHQIAEQADELLEVLRRRLRSVGARRIGGGHNGSPSSGSLEIDAFEKRSMATAAPNRPAVADCR